MKTRKENITQLIAKGKESIKEKKENAAFFKNGGSIADFKPAANVVRPF